MNPEDKPKPEISLDKTNNSISSEDLYYFDNDFMVFTEKFHLRRGYCCGNGCRHCPYSNQNSKNKT